MKKVIFTLVMVALVSSSFAQENAETKLWTNKGTVGLNFSQSSFTNWAAGGQNALNWIGTLNYQANYAKPKETKASVKPFIAKGVTKGAVVPGTKPDYEVGDTVRHMREVLQ